MLTSGRSLRVNSVCLCSCQERAGSRAHLPGLQTPALDLSCASRRSAGASLVPRSLVFALFRLFGPGWLAGALGLALAPPSPGRLPVAPSSQDSGAEARETAQLPVDPRRGNAAVL